jgi:hypothetical protein
VNLTPRPVNMVAIFVAAAAANNKSNKNNYSGKLKRKTATTILLKTVFQIHYKMGNDTSAKLKGHRGVATHSLAPCKFPCQAEEETQHKATHKLHSAGRCCTFLTEALLFLVNFLFAKFWNFAKMVISTIDPTKFSRFPKIFFLSNHQIFLDFHDNFHFLDSNQEYRENRIPFFLVYLLSKHIFSMIHSG